MNAYLMDGKNNDKAIYNIYPSRKLVSRSDAALRTLQI